MAGSQSRSWRVVGRSSPSDPTRSKFPTGVDVAAFAEADLLPGYPREGGTILFLGRYDEPRKGMAVLLGALPELVERHPDLEVIVVGRGDEEKLRKEAGKYFKHLRLLGQVSDEEKASALRSADVYCAPNLGGESFGIVLVEAMAAGTAVVASELDAFRRVLRDGQAGLLVPIGNSDALAEAIDSVLGDPDRRRALVNTATSVVAEYDWPVVAEQILRVYETVHGWRRRRTRGGFMTFSALTIFILGLVAAVVLVVGLWAYGTANRLDRLHVRSDQSVVGARCGSVPSCRGCPRGGCVT